MTNAHVCVNFRSLSPFTKYYGYGEDKTLAKLLDESCSYHVDVLHSHFDRIMTELSVVTSLRTIEKMSINGSLKEYQEFDVIPEIIKALELNYVLSWENLPSFLEREVMLYISHVNNYMMQSLSDYTIEDFYYVDENHEVDFKSIGNNRIIKFMGWTWDIKFPIPTNLLFSMYNY